MLYDRATTVSLPNSLLLHFAFADFEEVYVHCIHIRLLNSLLYVVLPVWCLFTCFSISHDSNSTRLRPFTRNYWRERNFNLRWCA